MLSATGASRRHERFSFKRLLPLVRKEWIQVRRDPMTLRLIIALPVMQLFLFGFAINTNPKNLPTGLLVGHAFQIRAHPRRGPAEHRLLRHPDACAPKRRRSARWRRAKSSSSSNSRRISTARSIAARARPSSSTRTPPTPRPIGNATAALAGDLDGAQPRPAAGPAERSRRRRRSSSWSMPATIPSR